MIGLLYSCEESFRNKSQYPAINFITKYENPRGSVSCSQGVKPAREKTAKHLPK